MSELRTKYVPPAINKGSFNCPHCGTLAQQFWYTAHAAALLSGGVPYIATHEKLEEFKKSLSGKISEEQERELLFAERMAKGQPFLEEGNYSYPNVLRNVNYSSCYYCKSIAIWLYDQLIWPVRGSVPLPNPDLPEDIRRDYDEASSILHMSPRGAAALLRLAIQKLCKELGESGKNIHADISALVKKGLHVRIQQALDIVRVIGNQAVHPGQLDLKDDRATAEQLFTLVNLIADAMITQPKLVQQLYDQLPEGARREIEKRDSK